MTALSFWKPFRAALNSSLDVCESSLISFKTRRMKIGYRPEIDGLRSIAVGTVLLYHLDVHVFGIRVFQGGFLGVDIFFVISGFLITSLIHAEYAGTGRFSLLDFYERRARRLLPALFAVLE